MMTSKNVVYAAGLAAAACIGRAMVVVRAATVLCGAC